ncbi:hypothetical protein BP6252_03586 [Coleophoma cylindrospora]|uniref:Peptidase M20 domain-containing protein 2 n=1 Tax=Coleophoma cylindrospora TaxID=1849047 RepID=A0A3D8S8P5_9HELO|nr:hypothetical protein BP6252_03586 [Coleophoma cylindrospora]
MTQIFPETVAQQTSTRKIDTARASIYETIDRLAVPLRQVNQEIHDHPEIGYEEVHAHATLTGQLKALGFAVTEHAYGLSTSFEAEIGEGGRLVVFCAEYDALPNIGHACGHNLIATSSLAAFIGLATTVQKLGIPGRVRILGTPAEEGGGGKAKLIDAGAFKDDISAAIMAHPMAAHQYPGEYTGLAGFKLIASHKLRVEFSGRSAHAGAEPWNGVNALDAAVASYVSISMLRQQIQPDERIHGVIEHGGTVPNVITAYTRVNYNVRSPTIKRADELLTRVKACFEAAAVSTGCTLKYIHAPTYMDLRINETLCKYYVEDMADVGDKILLKDDVPASASTDMGNVSYTVPSFHGGFAIPAPSEVTGHHPSFAKAAGTDEAHASAIRCAKGMAMLGWRVLTDSRVAEGARRDFEHLE